MVEVTLIDEHISFKVDVLIVEASFCISASFSEVTLIWGEDLILGCFIQ